MSGEALGWAKKVVAPSSTSKAVLICLADYADDEHTAWPAVPKLATQVQVSDRTVQRALRELETAGLITRTDGFRENGSQRSSSFRLAVGEVATAVSAPPPAPSAPVPGCHPPGDSVSPAPVSGCHPLNLH